MRKALISCLAFLVFALRAFCADAVYKQVLVFTNSDSVRVGDLIGAPASGTAFWKFNHHCAVLEAGVPVGTINRWNLSRNLALLNSHCSAARHNFDFNGLLSM